MGSTFNKDAIENAEHKEPQSKEKNDRAFAYDLANRVDNNRDGTITQDEVKNYLDTYDKIKKLFPEQGTVQSADVNPNGHTVVTDKGGNAKSAEYGEDFKQEALRLGGI